MTVRSAVITRVIEAVVHGIDLADALDRAPRTTATALAIATEMLDDLLARRAYPGRPADLRDDDLSFVRSAADPD